MTKEEMKNKYSAFITEISEILGLGKPVDILKLCATTDLFFQPLENRITELKKACEETQGLLDKQIEATYRLDKENAELKEKLKTSYRKGMRHMAKALKDYDRTDGAWTDYFEHTVDKVLQRELVDFEENGTLVDQITKAKEIILMLYNAGRDVLMCRNEEKAYDNLSKAVNDKSIEQFLSEVEK